MKIKNLVKRVLREKENKRYAGLLTDHEISYSTWLSEQEKLWNTEPAEGEISSEEFILVFASEGTLADYAHKNIGRYFYRHPQIQVLYGDEDVLAKESPWFKPDWSPDFLDSCPYFGSVVAVRRTHWENMRELYEYSYPGQWQKLFGENAEDRGYRVSDDTLYAEWLHDCVSQGYKKERDFVGHIPQILYHVDSREEQAKFLQENDYLKKLRQDLLRGFWSDCEKVGAGPMVSVVIPSKDQPEILRQCLEGVRTAGAGIPIEIIVVDNGSTAENRAEIEKQLQMLDNRIPVSYIYEPMEFNFSRMCNLGAEKTEGKLLLFLNDDVVLEDGCIQELAARAARAYTGAVGLKLLYPENGRIQHAGITNLPMGPVHKLQSLADNRDYYGKANHSCRNFLAVTAACLMVEKKKFLEAGGFSEELRVAFNDVDLCFRLYELGYHNVCVNDIYAYHHESLSRGADESREKLERLLKERTKLYEEHPQLEGKDPYYSSFLNRESLDVRITPAYLTAGNRIQCGVEIKPVTLTGCREDNCLMVRVEEVREGKIVGWSVILGDNNACYEKQLLLRLISESENTPEKECHSAVYGVPIQGQYRPDLEENMSDQINVALCGFWLKLPQKMPVGEQFQIGVLARNRVTGLKLINWSNRFIRL